MIMNILYLPIYLIFRDINIIFEVYRFTENIIVFHIINTDY